MKKCILISILLLMTASALVSQIMYNVSEPYSYQKQNVIQINELPSLYFHTDENDVLVDENVQLNLIEKSMVEQIDNKFILRVKIKVFAQKLGLITLIMDKVKLSNGAYCHIYTSDYKIIAGPIYQNSIVEYLIIKNIPADELIIEVVADNLKDVDIRLLDVNYFPLYKTKVKSAIEKFKQTESLLSANDSCHTCTDGEKSYADFVVDTADCGWLGYGHNGEIFNLLNFRGINDYNYDASRSSCVILTPSCLTDGGFWGNVGTLINFPYQNCESATDCNNSFVISVAHHSQFTHLIDAEQNNNQDYLNKILIRFNWHHEYGTPWNLQNIDCSANQNNFEIWRSSINFDEVIDYCGVNVFAFDPVDRGDFIILKMKQKPFYKEHHLGWSEQRYFNYENSIYGYSLIDSNRFSIIGRRAIKPTMLIKNYYCQYRWDPQYQGDDYDNHIELQVTLRNEPNNTDVILPPDFSGYSGCQLTYNDYNDSNQRIGLGLVRQGHPGYFEGYLDSRTYYNMFNLWNQVNILDSCYSSYTKIMDYMTDECSSLIQPRNYSYTFGNNSYDTTCIWMPSLNNKQKCPSQIAVQDSCNFDITNYITWNDSTKCITFDSIPANLFPGGELPKGYRIYYNDGEQKTLHYDSYNDNLPIELNYSHCFTSCELFDLFMQGKDSLNIAIDFYDSFGRILNNIGCENIEFNAAISFNLCSMFEITAEKTQSDSNCCTYIFTVSVKDSCAKNKPFLRKIANTLKLLNSTEDAGIPLSSIPGLTYNYIDGKITFSRQLCDSNSTDRFLFAYDDGNIVCNSPEIKPESCFCACPAPDISKDWITVTTTQGGLGESCPEGSCKVTINIDIPPFYNCFKFFKMGSMNRSITNGKATYSFCIPAGTARTDTILIKKNLGDQEPCIIIKHSYCPILSQPKFCKSGCDSVEWDERTLVNIPLPGCPNCFINAKYMTRTNPCEDKQELQVTEIEVYNSLGDTLACGPCLGNMAEIHKLVLLKAIHKNDMGFNPKLDNQNPDSLCDETWRVSISSCWAEYSSKFELTAGDIDYKPKKRFVPCDTVCCSVGLRVCRYKGQPDYITIDTIQGDTNPNLCNADSLFIYDPHIGGFGGGNPIGDPSGGSSSASYIVAGYNVPCINRCDWLDILTSGAYYGKRATPNEPTNNILVKNECRLLTYLHQESMNCIFDSDVNSNNFSISIFSITGELLLKENINVIKGFNEFSINLNGLNSGIYLIQAELNGICSKTDKLIIVK